MKNLIKKIELRANCIPNNTKENRRVKGAYVDCLVMLRGASESFPINGRSEILLSFFLWFRENGTKHVDKSIEEMIEVYEKEVGILWWKRDAGDSGILPFRMKIDEQVNGVAVIAFLSRNGIGLMENFSFPFNLILYKGGHEVLTMTDEWRWDKYDSIPLISYEEHRVKYSY